MSVRRLIVSDLHFGSGQDLLAGSAALERIEPELEWADELVVNGDLLELVFASVGDAIAAARPFLALADRHVERIHYIPGNHDHHLVSLAADERRFGELLRTGDPSADSAVAPAARLLRALCPRADVVTAYPSCELDGMLFMHGHYIAAHAGSSERWLIDGVARHLTGAPRPQRLTVEDYEGLIAPLYELMYEIANLPCGRRVQQRIERWLDGAAAIAHAPRHASHRLAALVHHPRRALRGAAGTPTAHVLAALQAVCDDLAIGPGTVVFGHTHVALDGVATPDSRHRVFNSGGWVWDPAGGADQPRPGTVLRSTGGELELRGLLDDCDDHDLTQMLARPGAARAA